MRITISNALLVIITITFFFTSIAFANTALKNKSLTDINIQRLIKVTSENGLHSEALKAALNAYAWARAHKRLGSNKNTLTVVDFTLPSYEKRMWVVNLKTNKILMKLYTTQGKGSGLVYARHFSNQHGTDASSLGLYVTSNVYYGQHGRSMRLNGLEKGVNNNARSRAIVIHSAYYATPTFIKRYHRAGRSWGCFAIAPSIKKQLLNYIKDGSAFFAYAAQENHDPIVKNGPVTLA